MSLPGWPIDSDPKPIFGDRDEFEAGLAADITEAGRAELLNDDMSELDRYITEQLIENYAERFAAGMAEQIWGPR